MARNAERGEGILDQGQLHGRAGVGKVAAEKTKLGHGRARFHLTYNIVEPRTAGWFRSVQIVYSDECEIISRRRVFAAEASGPKPEGKQCTGAGGKTKPFAASKATHFIVSRLLPTAQPLP